MRTHTHLRCNPNWDAYQLGSFLSGEGYKMRSRSELFAGRGSPRKNERDAAFFWGGATKPTSARQRGNDTKRINLFPLLQFQHLSRGVGSATPRNTPAPREGRGGLTVHENKNYRDQDVRFISCTMPRGK